MTRDEMIEKLTSSKNELVADKCKAIKAGTLDPENEKKFCGSFLRAVLDGDYETALARADLHNRKALLS